MFYKRLKTNVIEKMRELLISSFLVSKVSESLRSLTKNEQCEWITQVAHQKWATMSDSLRSLRGNEWCKQIAHQKWANEWITHFFERITHSLIFGQKMSDLLRNQMSEFPALEVSPKNIQRVTRTICSLCSLKWAILSKRAKSEWVKERIPNPGQGEVTYFLNISVKTYLSAKPV